MMIPSLAVAYAFRDSTLPVRKWQPTGTFIKQLVLAGRRGLQIDCDLGLPFSFSFASILIRTPFPPPFWCAQSAVPVQGGGSPASRN